MSRFIARVVAIGRTFGPYLALEMLLPGGSLIAFLLWLYRSKSNAVT